MAKQIRRNAASTSSEWPFDQPPNAAAISLRRIFKADPGQDLRQVLYVSHDLDDHGWQFLDGKEAADDDAYVIGMRTMLDRDPTLATIADLSPGWIATRTAVGKPWKCTKRE